MSKIEIPAAPFPAAFTEWLARCVDYEDRVGDLARDVAQHGGDAAALRLRCERDMLASWGRDAAPTLRELPAEAVGDMLAKAECAARLADGDPLEDADEILEMFDTAWREWTDTLEAGHPFALDVTEMTFGEDGGLVVTGSCTCGQTHTLPAWVSRFGAERSLSWTPTPCGRLALVGADLDEHHEEWLEGQLTEWLIEVAS